MKRREFVGSAGCRLAALMAAPLAAGSVLEGQEQTPRPRGPRYKLEIEIFEARPDTWCHKKGDKFAYPQDIGKICPWLALEPPRLPDRPGEGRHPALDVRKDGLSESRRSGRRDDRVRPLPGSDLQPRGQDHPDKDVNGGTRHSISGFGEPVSSPFSLFDFLVDGGDGRNELRTVLGEAISHDAVGQSRVPLLPVRSRAPSGHRPDPERPELESASRHRS